MTVGVSLATSVSSPEPNMASWQVSDPTADAVNPNATHTGPTKPEDESSNSPEALPSTLLKRGSRTKASNELRRVPVNESTTMQPMWMPQDTELSRKVHGVAKSHKEAAGDEVEGGEAGERTRTGDDEECQVHERINDGNSEMASQQVNNKATDTPNPHAKCAGPTRPVGTSHDPADELSGMQEGGRVAESEPEPISMPTDHTDEAKPLGDNPSDMAKVQGEEVQRGGYESGQGSNDGTMNDASGKSQQLVLKVLAEDKARQCRE